MTKLLVVSGPIAVGKSAVTRALTESFGYRTIRTGEYLRGIATSRGEVPDRHALQDLGDSLDAETDFRWVVDHAMSLIRADHASGYWIFDAARKHRQLQHFRATFGAGMCHIHFVAPEAELRRRYEIRRQVGNTIETNYERDVSHPNEVEARSLGEIADLVLSTAEDSPLDVARKANEAVVKGGKHETGGYPQR